MARIQTETDDWKQTRTFVLEHNALQTRSLQSGKRLETELRQRLQLLSPAQLSLLADGSSDDRLAMAWLSVLKRIQLFVELTGDLLLDKLNGGDPLLQRSEWLLHGLRAAASRTKSPSASSQKKALNCPIDVARGEAS